jgi:trimeric autotransporter adhesin
MAVINGTSGDDTLFGDGGNDTINGGSGDDLIFGMGGVDSLSGGSGNDHFEADEGILIRGNAYPPGVDTVNGGTGDDSYTNMFGDTVYQFSYGWGHDEIDDFSGIDTLDFSGYDTPLTISLNNASRNLISGVNTIVSDIPNSIENVIKGNGNDTITGNQYNNYISAGAGNDLVNGAQGNDTLDGGPGNDTLIGGMGDDTFIVDSPTDIVIENPNEGNDTVQSNALNYTLSANVENLTLIGNININGSGNALNNVLRGNYGNNILSAGDGNDTLIGGLGQDTLKGGNGSDVYQFSFHDGQDTILDVDSISTDSDLVQFDSTVNKDQIAFFMSGSNLEIGYAGSTDEITVQNQNIASNQIEKFQTSDGSYLTAADVNQVIQAMASYATTNGVSFTSLTDVENNASLLNIVASAWHT